MDKNNCFNVNIIIFIRNIFVNIMNRSRIECRKRKRMNYFEDC